MEIIFVTGNELKAKIASDILSKYNVLLKQQKIDTPEIQAESGEQVSQFSAKWACDKLKKVVVKSDVSYCIPSLQNFPGPYIKYINKWLSADDILTLMKNKTDRTLIIEEYLTLCSPNGFTHTFKTTSNCLIATTVADTKKGYTFDQILIRPGKLVPQNLLSKDELNEMFNKEVRIWHDLADFLKKNQHLI